MSEKENSPTNDQIDFPALYRRGREEMEAECLTVEELDAHLNHTSLPQRSPAAEDHLRQCDRCLAELEYLKIFAAGSRPAAAQAEEVAGIERQLENQAQETIQDHFGDKSSAVTVPMPPRAGGVPWWAPRLAAAAASLALLSAGIHYVVRVPQLPSDSLPGEPSTLRGRHIELLAPLGVLLEPPHQLSWQPVDNALQYTVRIAEVDATPVWHATVAIPQVTLPADVVARLQKARTYGWSVEAELEGGRRTRFGRGTFVITPVQKKSPR